MRTNRSAGGTCGNILVGLAREGGGLNDRRGGDLRHGGGLGLPAATGGTTCTSTRCDGMGAVSTAICITDAERNKKGLRLRPIGILGWGTP